MNRRDFIRRGLGGAAATTSYFVFGSGLWVPGPKTVKLFWESERFDSVIWGIRRDIVVVNSEIYRYVLGRELEKDLKGGA